MDDLRGLEAIVYDILVKKEKCRNSDNLLYIEVMDFFAQFSDFNLPRFESVARTRRKIQEWYPDLMSFEDVRRWRKENETAFKKYAKEGK